MPTHVIEAKITSPNFSQKHKAENLKLAKLKMEQHFTKTV